ncbi:MAG TPA: DNA phosphorothioation system sulfurtransferase DndC [Candidatus Onthoplasma faecipullorum]|nr:DNA phosphorothioation system sulfurtransferase DndC [Candidatus Onthoplasma faecipullorum]
MEEMTFVYKHDNRPWLIGYSGGKDSSLLVSLVIEVVTRLPEYERNKKIFIVTSDTGVENPIVKKYMHTSSQKINEFSQKINANIQADIIYPDVTQSYWNLVIGLGYPTPEPPGFRWCTERLKIIPMNKYTNEIIEKYGQVVLLLGVRKAESLARMRSISSREIEGKILIPHSDIKGAYVYNPLTEIKNDLVWEYLLKNNGISSWGVDMKYLFSLYQGENLGEEQSVIGEIDKNKIPVTGNSRFGCWCCTIVKEDKSLQNFINHGSTELIPLRDFRNWLVSIRQDPNFRDNKRRNGKVYQKENGEYGFGPFKMSARQEILKRLLMVEKETGFELITLDELKMIDTVWDSEGDLTRRKLVDIYYEVFGKKLPWDEYKEPLYEDKVVEELKKGAEEADIPFELITKLIVSINANKYAAKSSKVQKEFDKLINQEWIHYETIKSGLKNEDQKN